MIRGNAQSIERFGKFLGRRYRFEWHPSRPGGCGRFGGGWDFKIGVQWADPPWRGGGFILNLGHGMLRFFHRGYMLPEENYANGGGS